MQLFCLSCNFCNIASGLAPFLPQILDSDAVFTDLFMKLHPFFVFDEVIWIASMSLHPAPLKQPDFSGIFLLGCSFSVVCRNTSSPVMAETSPGMAETSSGMAETSPWDD